MPKCSVIIPAYNVEKYIRFSVSSVLSQTLRDLEIIVVDDGSTDNTYAILTQLAWQDSRIRIIRHRQRRGASCARNTALEVAQGEWIAWLDADDWMDAVRLERLIRLAERWGADMIADNIYLVDFYKFDNISEGQKFDQQRTLFSKRLLKALPRFITPVEFILGNMPGPRNPRLGLIKPLIRHAFITKHALKWREEVMVSQDTVFYFECLMHGARLLLIPEAHYYYLEGRPQSISLSVSNLQGNINRYRVNQFLIDKYGRENSAVKAALQKRSKRLLKLIRYALFKRKLCNRPFYRKLKFVVNNPVIICDYIVFCLKMTCYKIVSRLKARLLLSERRASRGGRQ
ncbi:glycosyltransferase family 2 protein [Rhodothermus profundi]|uniref:Succinoglycan biosynthesis protein ExoO n=1 Tax=Rhodothermus profundi TaxID=633813 RepID=A0A1M6XJ84_9BACT|nr:glycosyltransferase family 2 protein [Rhodothermus profundi]SHL05865.1 succinoglycan biosynthesis protein ExoO [Rhodothermus profundi]